MDLKTLLTVFTTIFLAELGDKTQLATMMFAAEAKHHPWLLFFTASFALMCAAGIAVVAGSAIAQYIHPRTLSIIAGVGFILIGVWTLISTLRA